MDTRFLETFLAVAERGSISGAARALNLTPAGVTQRIRALEAEVGTALLVRAGRGVRPSPAGARLAERARPLLLGLRDLSAGLAEGALTGELRLGAVTTATTGLLPDLLVSLRNRHPGLNIRPQPGGSSDLYAAVLDGTLDAAILVQPPFGVPKICGWFEVRAEPLILLAPAALQCPEPLSLIASQPFIRYAERTWGGKLAADYLRRRRIRPREVFELETLDAIAVLVNRGLGISVVPDWTPPWPSGLSLARLPLPDAPCRSIGVVWQHASPRAELVAALRRDFDARRAGIAA